MQIALTSSVKPMDNGYIESSNGTLRDEYLNQTYFSLYDACNTVEPRRQETTNGDRTVHWAG
ncbi:integrase core domain-containing protein [uncultured Desulfovibrio sp.]|uniref:integrase core domain-containing protein n=1 Tax=uncultured Desulfovibrio sp. TaxID=167968 RepID=UPI0034183AE0